MLISLTVGFFLGKYMQDGGSGALAVVPAAALPDPSVDRYKVPVGNSPSKGSEKAKVLKAALTEPGSGLPASMVHPINGRLTWLLDRPAAALLSVGKSR